MREIKFRLRIENKVVGYEKWYQGNYGEITSADARWLYSKDNDYWNPSYIHHRVKDQFTGLKDKNGKEIYEGDIVQPTTMNDGNLNLWTMVDGKAVKKQVEIKWNEKYAEFEIQLPTNDLEVIGNIYENPELLGGRK